MISEDSRLKYHIFFAGISKGIILIKEELTLSAFLIVIIKQAMYINKVSPLVGHMYMIICLSTLVS